MTTMAISQGLPGVRRACGLSEPAPDAPLHWRRSSQVHCGVELHALQLVLLEVGRAPEGGGHHGEGRLAGGDMAAEREVALGDPPVLRRAHSRIAEVEFRGGEPRPRQRLIIGQVGLDVPRFSEA